MNLKPAVSYDTDAVGRSVVNMCLSRESSRGWLLAAIVSSLIKLAALNFIPPIDGSDICQSLIPRGQKKKKPGAGMSESEQFLACSSL